MDASRNITGGDATLTARTAQAEFMLLSQRNSGFWRA